MAIMKYKSNEYFCTNRHSSKVNQWAILVRTNESKSFCEGCTQKGPGNSCEIQASLMSSYLLNIFTGCLIGILSLDFKHKLLIYLQICSSGNLLPFFQLLKPKILEFFLTPFILPQLSSIPSANSTSKIQPKPDHFVSYLQLQLWSKPSSPFIWIIAIPL